MVLIFGKLTLHVCSVPWGDIMSTVGDIMSAVGDILSTVGVFSTVGDIMSTVGDILSIVEDTQYRGGYHDEMFFQSISLEPSRQ